MEERQPNESLGRQIQFGAESAAGGGLDDPDPFFFKPKDLTDLTMVIMGVLRGCIYYQRSIFVHISSAGIRLKVGMFQVRGLIAPLYLHMAP